MPPTIVFEKHAERQFDALSPNHQRSVEAALDSLVLSGKGELLVVLLIDRRDHVYNR
ncbi:MAG: hypothetical protein GX774_06810 [Armatimonadetes bacterium]|jgi:mRNA-degrading endonuclease RelE of RelBE toxin-antitoxin system|nr:hypothetical protein [Armatimonadota bacterium]